MKSIMLVNVVEPEESRVAIVEDDELEELYIDRTKRENIVGNIYKGVVVNIVPSIDAAFVDFGFERHGFLHVSDVNPALVKGDSGHGRGSSDIRKLLQQGQDVLVQVTREGIGDKGPALTSHLSLPGRFLVLMPGTSRLGVSRKIKDGEERSRLRKILSELDGSGDVSFIARTAAEGKSKVELERDIDYLNRLWKAVKGRSEKSSSPALVYQEQRPVIRVIRDVFSEDMRAIIVDSKEAYHDVKEFLRMVMPRHVRKVKLYKKNEPIFHHHGISEELEQMYQSTVGLPSGGSIVFDQTEALVAVDVNSGQHKKQKGAEETAFRANLEAAEAIARQIRLRNLGGLLVIDFIDMEDEGRRKQVEKTLWNAFKRDRARMRMLGMSEFCLVEMTRQRRHVSVAQAAHINCSTCGGTGRVKSTDTAGLETIREIKTALQNEGVQRVEVSVTPEVANYLNNKMRARIQNLEETTGKTILVHADPSRTPNEHPVKLLDSEGNEISP